MNAIPETILLAEDDPGDILLAQRTFRKANLSNPIQIVKDGQEAIAYLSGQGDYADRGRYPLPRLILLDLKLPRKSGSEVLEWLRQQPGLKHLPVVVLTASKAPTDLKRAYDLGANSYLLKPVTAEALLDVVHTLALPLEAPLRVVLLDDDPGMRALIGRELSREFPGLQVGHIIEDQTLAQTLERGAFDLVITDHRLRWTDGLTVLRVVKARYPDRPVIMLTATGSEEIAVEAMKAGLDDYVLKSPNHRVRLPGAVRAALARTRHRQAVREAESRYHSLFEDTPIGLCSVTPAGQILDANRALVEMFGYPDRESLLMVNVTDLYADPEDFERCKALLEREGIVRDFEAPMRRRDGTIIWTRRNARAVRDAEGRILHIEGSLEDITQRKHDEAEIKIRVRQQAAVAEFGQRALMGTDLSALMNEAAVIVARTLEVEYGKILELLPDGKVLLLRAGVGWKEGYVGHATVGTGTDSQAGYTLLSDGPVIVEDLRTEIRFSGPPLLREHGVISGMSVIIASKERPFGVLGAHTTRRRTFTEDDIHFVQGIANILATAVERKQAEEELREGRQFLQNIIDNSPSLIYVLDVDGRFMLLNRKLEALLGVSRGELVGKTRESILPIEIAERHRNNDLEVIGSQQAVVFEETNIEADGEHIYFSVKFPLTNASGRVYAIGGISMDITDRKRAEEELLRLRKAVETSGEVVFLTDRDGVITFVNPEFTTLYGYTAAEVVGKTTPRILKSGTMKPQDYEQFWQTLLNKQVVNGEMINRTKDGRLLPLEVSANPILDESGNIIGFLAIQRDITERKRAEEEIRHRLAELEAVNRVSTALRVAQTLDEMLPRLLNETLAVLGTDVGSIRLYDAARDQVYEAVSRGWFTRLDKTPYSPREGGITSHVLTTGEVYVSREVTSDPRTREAVRSQIPSGWSCVWVPIRTAQEIIGVFIIAAQLPRQVQRYETSLLTTLAEIAGNAIHRARLHEQTERRLEHVQALHAIDMAISSSMDMRVTLNVLLEQVTAQLHVDAADILLLTPHMHTLEYAAGRGFRTKAIERARLHLGEGYAGRAALERRSVAIADLRLQTEGPFGIADSAAGQSEILNLKSEMFVAYYGVPLLAKGQVKGVLEIFHRAPLTPDPEWLGFLEALASQAAIAIDNAELFTNLQRANVELALAYDTTLEGWSRALDLRDKETEGHTQRVTEMTERLARTMGMSEAERVHVRRGALLHDIGKMGISDTILLKPGKLTDEEWVTMRKHPEYAYNLLSPISFLRLALDIPYCHHEKWDSTGYPRGLKGEEIPLAARIFAVVDVWDALTSDRPYRKAWSEEKARAYIREQAGQHFDPKIVETFLNLGREG